MPEMIQNDTGKKFCGVRKYTSGTQFATLSIKCTSSIFGDDITQYIFNNSKIRFQIQVYCTCSQKAKSAIQLASVVFWSK